MGAIILDSELNLFGCKNKQFLMAVSLNVLAISLFFMCGALTLVVEKKSFAQSSEIFGQSHLKSI